MWLLFMLPSLVEEAHGNCLLDPYMYRRLVMIDPVLLGSVEKVGVMVFPCSCAWTGGILH